MHPGSPWLEVTPRAVELRSFHPDGDDDSGRASTGGGCPEGECCIHFILFVFFMRRRRRNHPFNVFGKNKVQLDIYMKLIKSRIYEKTSI